jgi:hypothetical protein
MREHERARRRKERMAHAQRVYTLGS